MINAAIAFVTVMTVLFDISQVRHREIFVKPAASESPQTNQGRTLHPHPSLGDIARVRVDDLGSVPPSELYEVLLRATPEEIAALALKFNGLPNDGPTNAAIGVFFQAWAELDGKSALAAAFLINDVSLKRMAAGTVILSVSPSTAPELAAILKDHPDKDLMAECKGTFLDTLLERWSCVDAPAAAKFFENLGDTQLGYSTAGKIAHAWATVDPYAALGWAEKQKETSNGEREPLFNDVILGWCSKDVTAAAAYVFEHMNRPWAIQAATSVALAMFNQDPGAATSWLRDLAPGEAKMQAEASLVSEWADKDPLAAAHWMEKLSRDDQKAAIAPLMGTWVARDWNAASKWLATLSGDLRDNAIAAAVGTYQTTVLPSETLSWALSINNKETRTDAVQNVLRQWASIDPQAAATWIRSSLLSKEEKDQLLSADIFTQERSP